MLRKLQKPQWQPFFDRVSAALAGGSIDIEIVGPLAGAQPEARRVTLMGIAYDRNDDVFAVIAEGLEHNILHPRAINVDADVDRVRSLQVVDFIGHHHLVRMDDPLRLAPAES